MTRRWSLLAGLCAASLFASAPVIAQTDGPRPRAPSAAPGDASPVEVLPEAVARVGGRLMFLIINQEQLLTGSKRGQALLAEQDAARDKLRTEARAIDAAFEAEERSLTEMRATLPPADFRAKAEDFDKRVVAARRDQDARSESLAQEFDGKRRQFYASVAPALVRLMDRYGAGAVLDETSVLIADQSLIVTDAVIAEIDADFTPSPGTPPAASAPAAGSSPGPALQEPRPETSQ